MDIYTVVNIFISVYKIYLFSKYSPPPTLTKPSTGHYFCLKQESHITALSDDIFKNIKYYLYAITIYSQNLFIFQIHV